MKAVRSIALSVVVPLLDEAESLRELHEKLCAALDGFAGPWEVLFCDDGSGDSSLAVLRDLAAQDSRVRVISFRRRFGQTAAMVAGFEHARGDVLVPMDADLQNDPADIPRLVAKLGEGFDVVSGWRRERRDPFWSVTLPSRLGNAVARWATGVPLHDFGCTITAYRREILRDVSLFGEMHRFIPAWAAAVGGRITELPVAHHPRRHGRSKYRVSKAVRVVFDLIALRFLVKYGTRPPHFFGRLGLGCLGLAALAWGGPSLPGCSDPRQPRWTCCSSWASCSSSSASRAFSWACSASRRCVPITRLEASGSTLFVSGSGFPSRTRRCTDGRLGSTTAAPTTGHSRVSSSFTVRTATAPDPHQGSGDTAEASARCRWPDER